MAKSKVNGIKITFPKQGQSIHNDKNFTISGISTYPEYLHMIIIPIVEFQLF